MFDVRETWFDGLELCSMFVRLGLDEGQGDPVTWTLPASEPLTQRCVREGRTETHLSDGFGERKCSVHRVCKVV